MSTVSNGSRLNFLPVSVFSREMGRWMDELTQDAKSARTASASVWEDDLHFFFEFDLPGVSVENVEVKVLENVLHVNANRPINEEVNFIRQERTFGAIERQFSLPARIDDSNIQAEMNSGVLKVTVPKAPESRVKTIEIKGN